LETAQDILTFWFGEDYYQTGKIDKSQQMRWWQKDDAFDQQIQTRFGAMIELAKDGLLDEWRETARGNLALILLFDQFTRNCFRNNKKMYAYDAHALQVSQYLIHEGLDKELLPFERTFCYMPLEHAEDLVLQERCVHLFEDLAQQVDDTLKPTFDYFLDYAKQHHAVIAEFGRFPHRNKIFDRESTPEEVVYLKDPNAGF
jgi:uncharacterized protein (DUF924 family)